MPVLLFIVAVASWLVPGGGYFLIKEKVRGAIIFVTITTTFILGLYIGSIGVVDKISSKFAFMGQILISPAILFVNGISSSGGYIVYGKPCEIGQIYTVIAGMLNLLCIVNSVYMAYLKSTGAEEPQNVNS